MNDREKRIGMGDAVMLWDGSLYSSNGVVEFLADPPRLTNTADHEGANRSKLGTDGVYDR